METDEFGTVFVLSERRDVNGRGFRYSSKISGSIPRWRIHPGSIHDASEPCFRQPSTPLF